MKTERGEKCNCAGITRFVLAILCKKQVGSQSKMLIKSQKKKKSHLSNGASRVYEGDVRLSPTERLKLLSVLGTVISRTTQCCRIKTEAPPESLVGGKRVLRKPGNAGRVREHKKPESHMKQLLAESSSGDSFLGIVPFSFISPLLSGCWKIKLSHGVAHGFGVILSPQGK